MHTAFDDKYLEPKKNDYNRLIEYLSCYYNSRELINEEELKNVHTSCWIIMIWLLELKKCKAGDKFLNDIFVNMIATIHSLIHKDIKISNFLLRNSIENFIRFLQNHIKEINIHDSPDMIFNCIFSNLKNESFMHKNFEILKSIYSECCLYVHSTLLKDDNLCDCLIKYDSFYRDEEHERFINNFKNAYSAINNLLMIYNQNVFDNMSYNNQLTIRYYIATESLNSIFETWMKMKNNKL